MRQIGSLENETLAARFVDFLKTIDIPAQADADDETWLIWVRDENQIGTAREELRKFTADPDAQAYLAAGRQAEQMRAAEIKRKMEVKKNFHKVGNNWSEPLSKRAPLTMALIVLCVVAAVLGGGFNKSKYSSIDRVLMFADPAIKQVRAGDSFFNIARGEIWRVVTPIFLHGGLLHILFNLIWIYQLGSQIESKIGTRRYILLILAAAAIPNLLQGFLVGWNFLGISGVVFALFGYMWLRQRDGYVLSQQTIMIVLAMFVLGFTPMFGGHIAVWAHAGGLAVGAGIGYLPELLKGRR